MELGIFKNDVEIAGVFFDDDNFMFWSNDKELERFLQEVQDNGIVLMEGTGIIDGDSEELSTRTIKITEETIVHLINKLDSGGYDTVKRR